MKKISNILKGVIACFLLGSLLTACGSGADLLSGQTGKSEAKDSEWKEDRQSSESLLVSGTVDLEEMEDRRIADQTFELDINPLGEVMFGSYKPDTEQNPLADVTFLVSKDGKVINTLEGMSEDNIRTNETFQNVEAVSFPDYNGDGYEDIIIICSYAPSSGSKEGTAESEIRVYTGSAAGAFHLERELSETANAALAEKTIQSVLDFMGVPKSSTAEDTCRVSLLTLKI